MPSLPPSSSSDSNIRIAVIGAGSWGTALAAQAARRHPTLLWARQPQAAADLAKRHENCRYLPGITLPESLSYTASIDDVRHHLADAEHALVILGTPVAGLADACRMVRDQLSDIQPLSVVWTCKGFDVEGARLPHELAADIFSDSDAIATGVLSGPSFAREVAQGLPVALTVASSSQALCNLTTQALHGGNARVYASTDVIGVETGGALKNIIAVACGICDGLQLGTNARAALITRGLAEMTRFGLALGAQADTFAGLTGLGDLVLTATGDLSRNRTVGLELGRGRSLADILASGMTAEGVRCAQAALTRAQSLDVDLPITAAVCDVLFHNKPPAEAVAALLAREARPESAILSNAAPDRS